MASIYKSPGVYVEEVSSGSAPIVGVGTSTAGFIGVCPDSLTIPEPNSSYDPTKLTETTTTAQKTAAALEGRTLNQSLPVILSSKLPQDTVLSDQQARALKASTLQSVTLSYAQPVGEPLQGKTLAQDIPGPDETVLFPKGQTIAQSNVRPIREALGEGATIQLQEAFTLAQTSTADLVGKTLVEEAQFQTTETLPVGTLITRTLAQQIVEGSQATSVTVQPFNISYTLSTFQPAAAANEVKLCTNFGEFKRFFGDFSTDPNQNILAHAVYGFFRNGGTRCYVVRVKNADAGAVDAALRQFEAIDEIAIVVAPGLTEETILDKINGHCQDENLRDRVAIFDTPLEADLNDPGLVDTLKPFNSDYAAVYFPWIQVFDPVTKVQNPKGDGLKYVPPSGHVAGIYARVDTQRGVHKAPANVPILGAVGLRYPISKKAQYGLNPDGINCIRDLNGNIRVWGARTMGGDANGEFKYVSVRRLFNFLRESIDEGTQWVVFEPNTPDLWAKITRNINAFLTTVWSSGALFGNTPEEAFYVKCDEETNPPEVRDLGQVVTEIGVAVTKPAEFVIFRLSQWAGPGGS